ncbi:MAG TPA: SRPBCC family protein, partial [Ktedonobacteraceae bacterium]|nr:SRPBCC family protein [Ktedonobacteraceae bacterium]
GLISWLILPGEETPTTIVIHKDLTTENLMQLATWRLLHLNLENMTRHRFSPSYLGRLSNSEQARELAADASLGSSEPIAPYLEQAYPPQAMEPQQALSCTASIVINRPAETIFAYLSDPQHLLFEPGDSEGQGEEVKRTYHFFGIPVTLKVRALQVKETHQLTPGPIGLDTIFEQISTLHGRIRKSKIKIIEYEPPRIIAFTYIPAPLRSRTILTPASGNTIFTTTITMGSGCHPLIGFFWTSMVKQDLQNGLKRLKVSLESPEG